MSAASNYRRLNAALLPKFLTNYSNRLANAPYFDFIIFLPLDTSISDPIRFLQVLLELKTIHYPTSQFLIVASSDTSLKHSSLSLTWKRLMDSIPSESKASISFLEVCFQKILALSTLYKTFFQWMKNIPFSQAMICSSNQSTLSLSQLHTLFDSAKSQGTDLNLAAYTFPFYKGFLTNFWAMPLAYLFGRAFRNPSPPDFLFSKACLEFWLTLPWPQLTRSFSMHLFLTLSSSFSGLRLREIFLGEKEKQDLYSHEEIPEAVHLGLSLLSQHRSFLWNSTALLSSSHIDQTTGALPSVFPFQIYSLSDLNRTLQSYQLLQSHRHLQSHRQSISFSASLTKPQALPWNKTLLSLFQSFLKHPQKDKFEKIFCNLLFLKAADWAEEIRKSIHNTKQKAIQDQHHGFPWMGGEKGQHWHIHDQFEKKLHDDYTHLHDIKRNYL